MLPENRAILAQRWPRVLKALESAQLPRVQVLRGEHSQTLSVSGIQLESAWDPQAEAQLQASLVPQAAARLTVYGLAQGQLVRTCLARPALRQLKLVILSCPASRASLTFFDHTEWLADERLELVLAQAEQELEVPLALATGCLALVDQQAERLRDLLQIELARPYVSRGRSDFIAYREQALRDNRELVAADPRVDQLKGSLQGERILVAAAGPTLSDHFEELRASRESLIAVDAALKPLLEAGVVPDFVVTQDSVDYSIRAFFDVRPAALQTCRLIYFPASAHEVVSGWQGARFCAEQGAFGAPGTLWSSGSVLHPAVDLALCLGASEVRLFGADFATPRGRSHVSGSAFELSAPLDAHKPRVRNADGQQVQSLPNLISYLRDLERYIALHPEVRFENAGREGALILGATHGAARHAS